ncbi:DUF5683 domain-containing protein [Flavihumibacter profundi]|jgi:hypothetical protein|uniref:DUF5683 domain-containing protein n=1 Tax=Flavihumibacter profundi TaxID=2716883 RepID=UPI001CC7B2F3|nr:DUF5683 domain-containing protein [Flavihumibacter profundi]MBZ5856703.1 DUF5683 domain-containing protein [Flavihumibacter profundi]
MKKIGLVIAFISCLLAGFTSYAQSDTTGKNQRTKVTSTTPQPKAAADSAKKFDPRRATIRSALIPGWGQAYNKKYWKIPVVYAALGITGYIFLDNVKTYNEVDYAYKVSVGKDTANYDNVADYLKPFVPDEVTSLDNYRKEFRRNIDYSVLVFLLFWGLNVIDATVDAHLHDFDVSPNLSMKIKPMLPTTSGPGYGNGAGLSLVFDIHKAKGRLITGIR